MNCDKISVIYNIQTIINIKMAAANAIGFIGGGKIAQAMAKGFIAAGMNI